MKTAVLGATGLVGRTMLKLLEDCDWLAGEPRALASARSEGTRIPFRQGELTVRAVDSDSWADLGLVLMSAGGATSRRWAPEAAAAGAWVVDNSSAFRMEEGVPLVVPEINSGRLEVSGRGGIVANPNCSTIQIAVAAAPLADLGLQAVNVTTFQAVSGAGQRALEELAAQEPDGGDPALPGAVFPRAIAGNVIPAIGPARPDGSFEEEAKVVRELRKILGRGDDLAVSCTAVRVPVATGHCAALRMRFAEPLEPNEVLRRFENAPGVALLPGPHDYVTPREIVGDRMVHVGRLRLDPDDARVLQAWVVADNLLKGAAWNAVQIAGLLAAGRGA